MSRLLIGRGGVRALFAAALLALGVLLPLLATLSAPAAARLMPTARVLAPTVPPRVVAAVAPPASPAPAPPTATPSAAPTSPTPALPTAARGAMPANRAPTDAPTDAPDPPSPAPIDAPASPAPIATLIPTQAGAELRAGPAPILMYHYIRTVDPAIDPTGYALSVTPELFDQQMAWLHDQGYAAVRMDMLARCLRGEPLCPQRAVALTFDDGYDDAFSAALPVLQRYGFSATFYIISGSVGRPGYMTWEQLAELRDAGMEIGAHTIDHLDLTSLDPSEADRQISQSKADLERALGVGVTSFCYPAGLYNAALIEQARAAGFLSAATTRWDDDYSDVLALPRRRVAGGATIEEFAAMAQG